MEANMTVNTDLLLLLIYLSSSFESARAGSRTLSDESCPVQHGRPDFPSGLATCVPLQCLYVSLAWSSSCFLLCPVLVPKGPTGLLPSRDATHSDEPAEASFLNGS